jgi:translation initiation factor 3 subunit M
MGPARRAAPSPAIAAPALTARPARTVQEDTGEGATKLAASPGSAFADEARALYAAERFADLLALFAARVGAVFERAASDADAEGAANIVAHLLTRVPAAASAPAAAGLAAAFAAAPAPRPERRLQALVALYNVAWEPAAKLEVLLVALAFSARAGLADVMLGVVRAGADAWAADLRLGPADAARLYVAAADALAGCARKPRTAAREAARLLAKALATYEAAAPGAAAAGVPVAARVVAAFLRSPDAYHFDAAANPAVVALRADAAHAPLAELLRIHLEGSPAELAALAGRPEGAAALAAAGVSREAALEKVRLLALVGLAHGRAELSFDEVAAALDISEGEVEAAVVGAIGRRLLEARIDQPGRSVAVAKCAPRTFGAAQWAELRGTLGAWAEAVAEARALGCADDGAGALPRGLTALVAETAV